MVGKSLDCQDHKLMEESLKEPLRSYVSDKVSQSIKSLTDFYEDHDFSEEASFFQQIGVQLGIFPSKWQRQSKDFPTKEDLVKSLRYINRMAPVLSAITVLFLMKPNQSHYIEVAQESVSSRAIHN